MEWGELQIYSECEPEGERASREAFPCRLDLVSQVLGRPGWFTITLFCFLFLSS